MLCDTGLQIFLLVYCSVLTAVLIAFGVFLCCRKRSSKTVVDSSLPSRRVAGAEVTRNNHLESGIDADRGSINGNLYANVEEGRDEVYIQDERGITSNHVTRMSPSVPLSNLSRADGMFDMSEIQDEVEENLYSSAKEETDSGDTNYEEVMSVRSKERNSFSSQINDPKDDLDMHSTISSSSSSQSSVKNQPVKPIVTEAPQVGNRIVTQNEGIYSNVEKKHSSSSSSASSTSTIQDNIQLDQQNFKNPPQSNNLDGEDPVALHFQIFNQESYKKKYNSQHDLSRKSSSSSNDETDLVAALGPNIQIDSDKTSVWANQVFNDAEQNFEQPRQDSLSSSDEESFKEDTMENQPRLPDMIQEPTREKISSSDEEEEEDNNVYHQGKLELKSPSKESLNETDSSSSEDYEVIKSMIEVENDETEIHHQSSESDMDEDPSHPMESSSDDEENPQPSSSNIEKSHHLNENSNQSTSEDESSSDTVDSQSLQQDEVRQDGHLENDDQDNYNGSPLEHPKVTEIKILDRQNPTVPDSPVLVRQCTPVYQISSSSSSSDDEDEDEQTQQNVQPAQIDNLRGSISSSDEDISPKTLQQHPVINLQRSSSDEEQLHQNFQPHQVMNQQKSSSSDDEEPQQVINIRRSSLSSSDGEKPQRKSSSSSSSSDEDQRPPKQNLQSPQVSNLRRSSSGSPSSIFQRLNYDYVSVYTKVELARKKLRDKNYNNLHGEGINEMETDI